RPTCAQTALQSSRSRRSRPGPGPDVVRAIDETYPLGPRPSRPRKLSIARLQLPAELRLGHRAPGESGGRVFLERMFDDEQLGSSLEQLGDKPCAHVVLERKGLEARRCDLEIGERRTRAARLGDEAVDLRDLSLHERTR